MSNSEKKNNNELKNILEHAERTNSIYTQATEYYLEKNLKLCDDTLEIVA